jgi:hypothetical protein
VVLDEVSKAAWKFGCKGPPFGGESVGYVGCGGYQVRGCSGVRVVRYGSTGYRTGYCAFSRMTFPAATQLWNIPGLIFS